MRRPSLKAVSGFGALSLLSSVLVVAACSSDDSGGGETPAPTGGVTGSGGSGTSPSGGTPAGGSAGKVGTGGTPGSGGTPTSGGGGAGGAGGPPANAYDVSVVIDNIRFIGMGTPSGGAGAGGQPGGGSGGETAGGGGAGGTLAGGAAGGGGKASGGGAGKSSASILPPQFQESGGNGGASGGGAGGTAGSGGNAPSAGSGGTLGGGGTGGEPAAGGTPAAGAGGGGSGVCTPVVVTEPLITDFGDNWTTDQFKAGGYQGGLFAYPATGVTPVEFAVANGEATISGKIGDYSGFGVWLSCEVDGSGFEGIEFDIKGNAGPSGQLKFLVQTSPNVFDEMPGKDHDTCMPTDPAKQWESCVNPSKMISVTADVTHVSVTWAELGMGKPEPGVDEKQILGLQWDFTWPPTAAMPGGTGGSPGTGGAAATGGTPAATGGADAGGMPGGGANAGGSSGGGVGGSGGG